MDMSLLYKIPTKVANSAIAEFSTYLFSRVYKVTWRGEHSMLRLYFLFLYFINFDPEIQIINCYFRAVIGFEFYFGY